MVWTRVKIRSFEIGLQFRDREFVGVQEPGSRWLLNPLGRQKVEVVSQREPWLVHRELDVIVDSGMLDGRLEAIDLKDSQRGLVWIDGRFDRVLGPGLYAYWNGSRDVRVEIVDASSVRFEHASLKTIVRNEKAHELLDVCRVGRDAAGVLFIEGEFKETLAPGLYAFWRDAADSRVVEVDLRETIADVAGQEIMTADKVTLRMNAVVTYRVTDAKTAVRVSTDVHQSLYREIQLALRGVVGAHELDAFLAEKDAVAESLETDVRGRAGSLGVEILSVGIRDVILPGDMKTLMNRVTEAKKAAEANLIVRREETAAMRSQANTAKILADNPTLMRLRELEVLEKVAASGNLNVVLGEKGLADRVVNLL